MQMLLAQPVHSAGSEGRSRSLLEESLFFNSTYLFKGLSGGNDEVFISLRQQVKDEKVNG